MTDQSETGQRVVQPPSWARPRGYANGIVADGKTIFLAGQVDLSAYRENQTAIGTAYRRVIGKHFPTMSAIGVAQLVEPAALVEIEATAVLPRHAQSNMREKLDT